MAASNSKFIAGHYTATWDGKDIGSTTKGFEVSIDYGREDIRIDDAPGIIWDGIYTGKQLVISMDLTNAGAVGVDSLTFPTDSAANALDTMGQPWSTYAKALVLTPVTGINSANKEITFGSAILDAPPVFPLGNTLLIKRIRMRALPYTSGGATILFSPANALNRSSV